MALPRSLGTAVQAAVLWLVLVFPSVGIVQKFLGITGVAAYLVYGAALLAVGYRAFAVPRGSVVSEGQAQVALGLALVAMSVLFWWVYPVADAGVVGGGSDRDDALRLGVAQLLGTGFPYYEPTYLGNPITPMPGALLLSVPLALLDPLAWSNLVWLAAYGGVLRSLLGDWRSVACSALAIVAVSPVFLHALVTGSDLIANSLAVMVLLILASNAVGRSGWPGWVATALLGLALSWRANFLFLVPLLWSAVLSRYGGAQAAVRTGLAALVFTAVTLPFYLYEPEYFTPLQTLGKLRFSDGFAWASVLIPVSTAVLALVFALRDNGEPKQMLRHAFWLLSLPVIAVVVLSSIDAGGLELQMSDYALCALFYGVAGFWPRRPASDGAVGRVEGCG